MITNKIFYSHPLRFLIDLIKAYILFNNGGLVFYVHSDVFFHSIDLRESRRGFKTILLIVILFCSILNECKQRRIQGSCEEAAASP